ncbi:hypothetical protein MMC21_005276 [Puttea exsequens]|nr:hypothetical protein [Puttea exsequens]
MASLLALSSTISTETKKLAAYIQQNNLPDPSFAADGPPIFPTPVENAELQASRMELMKAAQDLAALALGPVETLRWQAWNQYNDNISLNAIMRYRIAEAIPLSHPTSFASVASSANLPLPLVTRLLRHAMMSHIFHEPTPNHVAHTLASASLLQNTSVRDWLDMTFEEWGPAAVKAVDAMQKFPGSQEPRETGFGLAFGGKTIFEYLGERPERAKVFGSAMGNFSRGVSHRVEHLVGGYDWKGLGKGSVVDIGGSHGHISIAIADAAPDLSFVVEDLPYTAADGDKLLPEKYRSRISFLGHDMHNAQPVHGASLYLFRSVLLNWPDAHCIRFLRALIPALTPGARILINEGVLPEPETSPPFAPSAHQPASDTPPRTPTENSPFTRKAEDAETSAQLNTWDTRILRNLDLCMAAMFNSKERTVAEWKGLFESASGGFRFLGVKRCGEEEGGLLWLVEAVWEGEGEQQGEKEKQELQRKGMQDEEVHRKAVQAVHGMAVDDVGADIDSARATNGVNVH